jgi:hypothetical protein
MLNEYCINEDGETIKVFENAPYTTIFCKNFRTLAEECKIEGTDYVRVVTKNNAFFLGKKSYFIGSSLQGKGFEEIKKMAQDILICESSIDCQIWISCIYKKEVATSYGDIRDLMPSFSDIIKEETSQEKKKAEDKEKIQEKKVHIVEKPKIEEPKKEKSFWGAVLFYGIAIIGVIMCLYMCTHLDTYNGYHEDTLHMPHNSRPD